MIEAKNIDDFDELQLLFGDDYIINPQITIHHPTLGAIMALGESTYFRVVQNLTCIPSDMKSVLWDHGIDYEEMSDFDLFCMLVPALSTDETKILFGDNVDFTKMKRYHNEKTDIYVLADLDNQIFIDEYTYLKIVLYLRKIHGIKPKIEHAYNKSTKDIMIMLDRQDREAAMKKGRTSSLAPIVSSLLNSPGFKYKASELGEVHYYEFMDSARRINALKRADQLIQGIYAGNIDPKKMSNKDELDGFRDLSEKA